MVYIGKERYWNIIDSMSEDMAGKPSYRSTRIVEVKIISVKNKELALEIWDGKRDSKTYAGEVTTRSFESASSRRFRPHCLNSSFLPRASRQRAFCKLISSCFGGCLETSPDCSLSLGGVRRA